MKSTQLPQQSLEEFVSLIQRPYSVVLDSSDRTHYDSQYSYIGFDPYSIITVQGDCVTQQFRGVSDLKKYKGVHSFFQALCNKWIDKSSNETQFTGGLMGYMSYESMMQFSDFLHLKTKENKGLPDMIWGIYDRVICMDHKGDKCSLIVRDDMTQQPFTVLMLNEMLKEGNVCEPFTLQSEIYGPEYEAYKVGVDTILDWIRKGHTYQVNFSQRYQALFRGDPLSLYLNLRRSTSSSYGAYLNYPMVQICSTSPELLVSKVGTRLITRPIKGTVARGDSVRVDLLNKQRLQQSVKDKAELTMIVDLERNDLRRVCQTGTVSVGDMHRLESFSHVHHLVSDVSGTLSASCSVWDVIVALFPGGSITGAPKIRSVELIDMLELDPRFVYTGCIGCIGFNGMMKLNIAIRTLYAHNEMVFFHSGCGIVSDSDPEKEWMEFVAKAQGIYSVLDATSGKLKNKA
jgi:para-aminobenzoate synthetase component 1